MLMLMLLSFMVLRNTRSLSRLHASSLVNLKLISTNEGWHMNTEAPTEFQIQTRFLQRKLLKAAQDFCTLSRLELFLHIHCAHIVKTPRAQSAALN